MRCMPAHFSAACAFRPELYGCLERRADALFELVDAAACGGAAGSLPHLSLVPAHRRGHGSVYAALREGAVDADRVRWSSGCFSGAHPEPPCRA